MIAALPPAPDATREESALDRVRRVVAQVAASPAVVGGAVAAITFALASVFWPHAADGLLRILIAALVLGGVASYGVRVIPPRIKDPYSPFERESLERNPPAAPSGLRRLRAELGAAAGRSPASEVGIPPPVKRRIREEVSRRLARNHGVSLGIDPLDDNRIRSLLSQPTWLLLTEPLPRASGDPQPRSPDRLLPRSALDLILDDLENL